MHRLSILTTLAALLLAPCLAAAQDRIDPAEAGRITAELEAREKEIRQGYGNRSNKEMERDERKEMEAKIRDARSEVLEEHGTSNKSYEVGMARLSQDGLRGLEASKAEHAKKLEADKASAAKGDAKPEAGKGEAGEVQVQRGFDDNNPVTVGENGVQVQQGGGEDGIDIPVAGGDQGAGGAPAEGGAASK